MRNTTSRRYHWSTYIGWEPIPTGVVPLPVRLPNITCQPTAHDAQRMLEAMAIAFGSHDFTAMRITPDRGTTNWQLVTITMLPYRSQRDTSLMVTIEHTQRFGLLAIARWALTDGRGRRRETKPLGFEFDANTTSTLLARRIAHTLDAYEARVCAAPMATSQKHAA